MSETCLKVVIDTLAKQTSLCSIEQGNSWKPTTDKVLFTVHLRDLEYRAVTQCKKSLSILSTREKTPFFLMSLPVGLSIYTFLDHLYRTRKRKNYLPVLSYY